MASIGTIALTGKSGTAFQFNIYPRSAKFAAVGVAYVMAKQNGNNYILIYIGQTGDASQRPFNHHRKDCFDRHGVDYVLVRAENDEKTRLTVETDLRQTYDPPCNRQ